MTDDMPIVSMEARAWQDISTFPFGTKWALAHQVLCGHAEKRWIRFGRYYAEQKLWYYSTTNEANQFAQKGNDAPTHWRPLPAPPEVTK